MHIWRHQLTMIGEFATGPNDKEPAKFLTNEEKE
jgi:hypothetical protein